MKGRQANPQSIFAAIDIGSTKIVTVIAQMGKNQGPIEVIGMGQTPSLGMKKGIVVNIEEAKKCIEKSIHEAELMAKMLIPKIRLAHASGHVETFNSMGILALNGRKITERDLKNILDVALSLPKSQDREILEALILDYKVDGVSGIKNPIGLKAYRLEVTVHVVTVNKILTENITQIFKEINVPIEFIALAPIASVNSIFGEEEKEGPILLIDIGGGTTDLAYVENNTLLHTAIIPIGGINFTNDLSSVLKISMNEAEKIKQRVENFHREECGEENFQTSLTKQTIPVKIVNEILYSRAFELFQIIEESLKRKYKFLEKPKKIILTGGGSMLSGLVEMAEIYFKTPAILGSPKNISTISNVLLGPKYATVLGLLAPKEKLTSIEDRFSSSKKGAENLFHQWKNSLKKTFNLKQIH